MLLKCKLCSDIIGKKLRFTWCSCHAVGIDKGDCVRVIGKPEDYETLDEYGKPIDIGQKIADE